MKKLILSIICGMSLMCACSENSIVPANQQNGDKEALAISEEFELVVDDDSLPETPQTRASYQWITSGSSHTIKSAFSDNDRLAIFTDNVVCNYGLKSKSNDGSAYFSGDGFDLTKGKNYYGFFPYIDNVTYTSDKTKMPMTYRGQRQIANDDMSHLGRFDYQTAYSSVEQDGFVRFSFKHLGVFMRVRVSFKDFPDAERPTKFKKFELVPGFAYRFKDEQILDLTDDDAPLGEYAPFVKPVEDDAQQNHTSPTFILDLGEAGGEGLEVDTENNFLVMYFMFPPTSDLTGQPLFGKITASDEKTYFIPMNISADLKAGGYGNFGKKAAKSGNITVSLRVNKEWQIGNTKDITRAGDPGVSDKLPHPTHLYIYTCKNGKYYSTTPVEDSPKSDWDDLGDVWRYKKPITIEYGSDATSLNTYFVASYGPCSPTSSSELNASTMETVVKGMTVSAANAISHSLDSTQTFLKNIYVYQTPVNLDMPTVTANLYHAAAKVDVQWNSAASLATGSVTIKYVPNTIKIFNPTECEGTSYSPSFSLAGLTSMWWNGRYTFYIPQPATPTFSITVGGQTHSIPFDKKTPNVDNFTSWFKANIRQ